MFASRQHENDILFAIRWTAHSLSAVSIGALLLLIFSNRVSLSVLTWEETGLMLLFPVGLVVGLILGWHEEGKGGAIAVFSVAAFYVWYGLMVNRSFIEASWVLLFLIPGLLLLLYGALLPSKK
jgi:hypothetical protein